MADFDDDLLALAGDESEGEEQVELRSEAGPSRSPSPAPARSPSPQHSPTPLSSEDKPAKTPARRGVATKAMSKGVAKRRKAEESEEEGEASSAPSSPHSDGSAAMDESDSDTSPADIGDLDEDNLYPLEGKFRDSKDRASIMAMTQLEREEILAEREEEQASKKRDLQLRSLLESKDREAEKSLKKRKAGAAELDDTQRKTTRPKPKRDEALESYTRQREQARDDKHRRERNRTSRRSRSNSSRRSLGRDADGESEDEYSRPNVREPEPEVQAELADIQRIRISRDNFGRVCFYPTFEETMIGCFARVCVGQEKPGVNVYRITQIKGITTGKPYMMEARNSTFYTDQYALLASGKSTKEYPFTHCSESHFTEPEFERWKVQLKVDGISVPTRTECRKQCDKINALIEHRFTGEELNVKLEKQHKYRHLLQPILKPIHGKSNSNDLQEKIRLRNEKNRKQNAEDVRKALVAEKNRQRAAARAKAYAAKKDMLAIPKNEFDDLFSGGSDISRAATPTQDIAVKPLEKKGGIPTFTKMAMDDDIIGTMDLGIDIDI